MVSYSGPSPSPANPVFSTLVFRPHPMGHPKHAEFLTRKSLVSRSPSISSHPSNVPCCQFLVGRTPKFWVAATTPAVPLVVSPKGTFLTPSINRPRSSLLNDLKRSLSAKAILSLPFTTTAFRFLLPITAPTPDLPAARCRSFIMDANRTFLSPAGPIQATFAFISVSDSSISVVLWVSFPQRWTADLSSALPFSIHR